MCAGRDAHSSHPMEQQEINNDSSQFSMMFVVSAPIILFIYFVCLFIYLLACEFICIEKRMALKCIFYNILA